MKKIGLLHILLIVVVASNAQNKKIEFRGSIGILSDAHIATALDNSVVAFFSAIFANDRDFRITTSGVYAGDLLIGLNNPDIQLTASYVYEHLELTKYDDENPVAYTRYMNTVLSGVQYNYIVKKNFSLYSAAQVGFRFNKYSGQTDRTPITQFAYQLTGAGIRYGRSFAGFTEIGFGAKGWLRTGISLGF